MSDVKITKDVLKPSPNKLKTFKKLKYESQITQLYGKTKG